MIDYPLILLHLVPDAHMAFWSSSYDDVEWLDDRPKPSREQCDAAWPAFAMGVANEAARRNRAEAFRDEADPLFFGSQRGENTEQEWLDKVAEIRARFPYVTE